MEKGESVKVGCNNVNCAQLRYGLLKVDCLL